MNKNTSNRSHLLMVTTAAVVGVLSIHFGIALALVNMQIPEPRTEKPKESKPIEIELVKIEEKKPEPEPEPEPEVVELKLSDKTSKVVKSRPKSKTDEKPKKTATTLNKPPINKQPFKNQDQNKINQTNQDNSPKNDNSNHGEDNPDDNSKKNENMVTTPDGIDPLTTQQTQKVIGSSSAGGFKQQSGNSNVNNNVTNKSDEPQTAGGNKNSGSGNSKKVPPPQPSYSGPQNFTVSEVRWKRAPNLVVPPRVLKRSNPGDVYTVVLELIVDKQGNITDINIIKSSKNDDIDKAAIRQVNRGKLHPFKKDGVPVVSRVKVPFGYEIK